MLTGLPEELPEEPVFLLVRVVTGLPADPEPPDAGPCEALVRVVTGAVPAVAPGEREPLVRVATAVAPADSPLRDLLALVVTDPAPRPPDDPARAPAAPAARWCLVM